MYLYPWMDDIIMILLFQIINGSSAALVWFLTGKIRRSQGYWKIWMMLLKLSIIQFAIPWQYFFLKYRAVRYLSFWYYVFMPTIPMQIGELCILLVLFFVAKRQIRIIRHNRYNYSYISGVQMKELSQSQHDKAFFFCKRLGIRKKVPIYIADSPPCFTTMRPSRIVIPDGIGEDEFLVSLVHELTHLAHKDHLWKRFLVFMGVIHGWNPLYKYISRQYAEWAEYACDQDAKNLIGSGVRYFAVIMQLSERLGGSGEHPASALFSEEVCDLENRMRMMAARTAGTRKRSFALLRSMAAVMSLCLAFSFGYAATVYAVKGNGILYDATVIKREVKPEPAPVIETGVGFDTGVRFVEAEVTSFGTSGFYSFEWEIPAGNAFRGGSFYLNAGGHVNVSVTAVIPEGSEVEAGIIRLSTGIKDYITTTGGISSVFTAGTSGYYAVYVANLSDNSTVNAYGSYYIP